MVLIKCSNCKVSIEVKNRRFKLCPSCKKERSLKRARNWKKNNMKKNREITNKWREEHKEHTSEYNSIYNVENREEIQARQTVQHRERKKTDVNYRLATEYRSYLSNFMRGNNDESGYFEFKRKFLIKWFTFLNPELDLEDYGIDGWNIDHVIPCSWFNLENDDELKQSFHWSNLQPIASNIKNLKKGNKITEEEVYNFELKVEIFASENNVILPEFDRYRFFN